jgi:hypothetical protein
MHGRGLARLGGSQGPLLRGVNPRDAIEQVGGLYALSDLADRWGITRQWARVLMRRDGMPAPVLTAGGRELWFGDEADAAFTAHALRQTTRS